MFFHSAEPTLGYLEVVEQLKTQDDGELEWSCVSHRAEDHGQKLRLFSPPISLED